MIRDRLGICYTSLKATSNNKMQLEEKNKQLNIQDLTWDAGMRKMHAGEARPFSQEHSYSKSIVLQIIQE